jgi:hypothetical protein
MAILARGIGGVAQPVAAWSDRDPTPGCWIGYVSPAAGSTLTALAVHTPDDIWAVGSQTTLDGQHTQLLTQRWDGATWRIVPSPGPTDARTTLTAVSAAAANDAWALGTVARDHSESPLILHWDGIRWAEMLVPALPANTYLTSIAAVGPATVWLAGSFADPRTEMNQALLLRWDGQRWQRVVLPNTTLGSAYQALAVAGPGDVWALGGLSSNTAPGQLLARHWTGTTWETVPNQSSTLLEAAAVRNPSDIWAVGSHGSDGPQAVHWDGQAWHEFGLPHFTRWGYLTDVRTIATVGADAVWAFGAPYEQAGPDLPLMLHWTGSAWKAVEPPPLFRERHGRLEMAAGAGDDLWVAGAYTMAGDALPHGLMVRHPARCPAPTTVPGAGSQVFPRTWRTVQGAFLAYWEAHGGVATQGLPISDMLIEPTDGGGAAPPRQYFERVVLEYHADAPPESQVVALPLGQMRYAERYPEGAPYQVPNTSSGAIQIAGTGHWIGGSFLAYWQAHGGQVVFGLPLTDEFSELSTVDGQLYTIQYFTNAVFEYHPREPAVYRVLLSPLGRFQYGIR